jgi:hypothetical protein
MRFRNDTVWCALGPSSGQQVAHHGQVEMTGIANTAVGPAQSVASAAHSIADLRRMGDRSVMVDIETEPAMLYSAPSVITDARQISAASAELQAQFIAPRQVTPPGRSVTILRDVTVLPNAAIVTADGHIIRESCFPYTDRWLGTFFAPWITDGEASLRVRLDPHEVVDRPAVYVREHGEMGFFHWMHSVLPRADVFARHGLSNEFALLCASGPGFQREGLALARLEGVARIAPLPDRAQRFHDLIFPSPLVRDGDFWLRPPSVADFYDGLSVPPARGPRRLYITRRDAQVRRLRNEEALLERLRPLGFVAVDLETWSFAAQLAVFRGAEIVVGVHGAGLSHVIGMPRDAAVLEILHPRRFWPTYRAMSARRGLRYGFLVGEDHDAPGAGDGFDFDVDIDRLLGVLGEMGMA